MKLAALLVAGLLMGREGYASGLPKKLAQVDVCMEPISNIHVALQSKSLAAALFARIGVMITWHRSLDDCGPQGIRVALTEKTPASLHPGALGYAMPYEGVHIGLFYDRIADHGELFTPYLLAYSLAHELAHVLQRVSRHSPDGIMKPKFTQHDYDAMLRRQFTFSPADIDLIHLGLASRPIR